LYLPFDGVALDKSGYRNDGTINGTVLYHPAHNDRGLNFNGLTNYVDVGNNPSLNVTTAFSICFWFKSTLSGIQYVYMKDNFMTAGFIVSIDSTGFIDTYTSQASAYQRTRTNSGTVSANTWTYCIVTYSGTSVNIYLNNAEASYQTKGTHTAPAPSTANTRIGIEYSNAYRFAGVLDSFRVYDRVLSTDERTALYNQPT
jgi:hypothetical protein